MQSNRKLGGCRGAEQGVMNYSFKVEAGKTRCQPANQAERRKNDGRGKVEAAPSVLWM